MRLDRPRSALLGAALVACSCNGGPSAPSTGVETPVIEEGRPASGDDGAEGCGLDGYACGSAGDCCSGLCTGGLCGEAGTCTPPGAGCTTADTCCSRVCLDSGCAAGD